MRKILLIAPGHDSRDRRINRSIEAIKTVGHEYRVIYESKYKLSSDIGQIWTTKERMYSKRFLCELKYSFDFDCIWIHDSGLFGLELVRRINRLFREIEIIFDYHDWIEWEIYYQIKKQILLPKIVRRLLYFLVLRVVKKRYRKINISVLIGISHKQIEILGRNLGLNVRECIVVPNTRKRLVVDAFRFTGSENDGVLWIGNVMRGRDLEKLADFIEHYNNINQDGKLILYLVGRILSIDLYESLRSRVKVVYLGEFSEDKDIVDKIAGKNLIGFFYGWIDSFNTGINAIASPNKVYSMLNIQIPLILGGRLREAYDSFDKLDVIQFIWGEQDFVDSINFFKQKKLIISNKEFEWEDKIKLRLVDLLQLIK